MKKSFEGIESHDGQTLHHADYICLCGRQLLTHSELDYGACDDCIWRQEEITVEVFRKRISDEISDRIAKLVDAGDEPEVVIEDDSRPLKKHGRRAWDEEGDEKNDDWYIVELDEDEKK